MALHGFKVWTAALAVALVGAAGGAQADGAVITGSVVYLERMLLPAGAEATVTLEDVSLADAPSTTLSEVTVGATTSPTHFALSYPAEKIVDRRSYALRATISADGALLFSTTDHYAFDPAMTDGVELLVRRVADAAPTATIYGNWLAEDIAGTGVLDNVQSTLSIAADGGVTGRGGCNGFGGSATIEGSSITFGPLAGTLMACAEAINAQEQRFHDALSRTASWRADEAAGQLFLLDAGGAELVRFTPLEN